MYYWRRHMQPVRQDFSAVCTALSSLSEALDSKDRGQILHTLGVYRTLADRGDPSTLDNLQIAVENGELALARPLWNRFLDTCIGAKSGEIGKWWHGEFIPAESMASKVNGQHP